MAHFISYLAIKNEPTCEALGINLDDYPECTFVQTFELGDNASPLTIYQFFLRKKDSLEHIDLIVELDESAENRSLLRILQKKKKAPLLPYESKDARIFCATDVLRVRRGNLCK